MNISSVLTFSLAILILAVSPGPGVFATVARSLASGFRPSLAVICGIVLGDITYLLFAIFGLSMVARVMGDMFLIVKVCGGAYLVWIGIKLWLREPEATSTDANTSNVSGWGNLASGLLLTLSNPKVILFYCGLLPTLLDLTALTTVDFAVVVAIVTLVLSLVLGTYAFLASRTREFLTSRLAVRRLNRTAGGLMVATGVVIATRP